MLLKINQAFKRSRSEDGFTLIELLIVIVIIGILAAIAIPIFLNQQKAAINATVKSDVRNTEIAAALSLVRVPQATGFTVYKAKDIATFATGAIGSSIVKADNITVPFGQAGVQAVISGSNTIAMTGNYSNYTILGCSPITHFGWKYDSTVGHFSEVPNCDTAAGGGASTNACSSGVSAKVINVTQSIRYPVISPNCSTAFALDYLGQSASLVDVATGTLKKTLSLAGTPSRVLFNSTGTIGYILQPGSGSSLVSVIDLGSDTITEDILLSGSDVSDIIISPDNSKLYVSNYYGRSVGVVDLVTSSYSILVGGLYWGPVSLALSPDGAKLFVLNNDKGGYNHAQLNIIDMASRTVTRTSLPSGYYDLFPMTFNNNGTELWVPGQMGISVFNVSDNSLITTIASSYISSKVFFSKDGTKAYTDNGFNANSISIFSTATYQLQDSIQLTLNNTVIYLSSNAVVSPDGKWFAVTGDDPSTLFLIDLQTKAVRNITDGVTGEANPPAGVTTMTFSPDSKWLYYASAAEKSLHVVAVR